MKKNHRLVCFLLVGLLILNVPTSIAQNATLAKDAIRRIDEAVLAEMQRQEVVGLAVGVICDGRIVYVRGYGLADREAAVPVDRDTMFRWASISKPVTAIAAMQLVEQGKLRLDDDVRQYVPEFPDKGHRITVRHLLCHQGGIVHYTNGEVIRTQQQYTNQHPFADVVVALDTFKESPLVCLPGEKNSYSTHGYILLSAVVERAGGQPFADQVQQRITKPLGLGSLQPDYQWVDIPNRTKGYRRVDGKIVGSTDTDVSWKLGGGGFISTIDDMARFATAVTGGRLLQATTWRDVATVQHTNSGEPTGYGLGLSVSGQDRQLKLSHGGSQEKVRARLTTYPKQGSGVVVMCNSEYSDAGRFSTLVFSALSQ